MKKNALKIVAAIIGVAGVYLVYRYIRNAKKGTQEVPEKKPLYVIDVPAPTKINEQQFNIGTDKYPLSNGSRGNNVKLLQKAINGNPSKNILIEDGIFGAKTEAALSAKTGKKSVSSQKEILDIASSNGLGFKMDSTGKIILIPKSEQNILIRETTQKKLPLLFG